MIYLPILTLLVFACAGGGVLAAPSEAAPVRTPLELTFPAIQSDQYMQTDYIDSNKTPVQGSGSKIKSCSIPPLIDHKSLVCIILSSLLLIHITYSENKMKELNHQCKIIKATGQSTILPRFLHNKHNVRRLIPGG